MQDLEKKIESLLAIYKELQTERDTIMKEQSEIDKELSELYHEIEGTKFKHVCQSHKMLIKLQDTLTKRRNIKGKVAVLLAFTDSIGSQMKHATAAYKGAKKKHDEILAQLISEVGKKNQVKESDNQPEEK